MEPDLQRWSMGRKLAFRFFATYFILYLMTLFASWLFFPLTEIAGKILGIPGDKIQSMHNGSGDTTYHYLQILSILLLTPVITVIWSITGRKTMNYSAFSYWLLVVLRYVLMAYLLIYGFGKIFMMQFRFPSLVQMVQPFGYSSPMGVAWNFMGYSYGFRVFTGLAEITGGLLLLFRKTKIFGALFSMTVLANVVAMNFFYDIPVKLFSSHLFLMAAFIASADWRRLTRFFFSNKDIPQAAGYPVLDTEMQKLRIIIKSAILLVIALLAGIQAINMRKKIITRTMTSPLYGVYEMEQLVRNNVPVPLLVTDTAQWRHIVVEHGGQGFIGNMDDNRMLYEFTVDTEKRVFKLNERDNKDSAVLYYSAIDPNHLGLKGMLRNDSVNIIIKKKNLEDYRLIGSSFHWVSDHPRNR